MTGVQTCALPIFTCYRPTPKSDEDLFAKYSQDQKDKFMEKLEKLIEDGERAINNQNQRTACEKWQKHFGERFSCSNAKDELDNAKEYSKPTIIKSPAKSA